MVSFPISVPFAGTNITFDFKVTSQPWFTCEQCNSELQSEGKKVRLMLCVHCAKRCHDGADSASFLAFSELQVVSRRRDAVDVAVAVSRRCPFHTGHRGIKYLRTSKVACMCFECCDCVLMKEVEQKARKEGIVPLNKLARYEAEEVKRRVNLGRDVPAVLALLPERSEKDRKKGYFGAQVEGWCLARRAEFTDPVDGWQILVDPQQCALGVPIDAIDATRFQE